MRGTVAKRLRKMAYGDMADVREYHWDPHNPGVIRAGKMRGLYQVLKKMHMRSIRG